MKTEGRKFPVAKYFLILISYFSFFVILVSCGKKGEPTLKSYEKPDPPANLSAIHRESEIVLIWDFPKNREKTIKGFFLMKSVAPYCPLTPPLPTRDKEGLKGSGGDFERLFFKNDVRSYVDREFKIGTAYTYKIVSQNLRNILSVESNVVEIEPKEPPPPPRKPLYKIEYDLLTLTWEDVEDGIFYNIYKDDKKGVYSLSPVNTAPIKGTSIKGTSILSLRDIFDIKKTVYYTIRSLRGGALRDEGPPSEEIEVNPSGFVPVLPEGLQAIAKEEGVQLLWKEAHETWVIGYKVYREKDEKEGFVFIGETSVPAYFDREKPSTRRNYRVTALGPSKEGPAAELRDVVFVPYR